MKAQSIPSDSGMDECARLAFVALQAKEPAARALLVSGVNCSGATKFAASLRSMASDGGIEAEYLNIDSAADESPDDDLVRLSKLANLELARAAVRSRAKDGYLLISTEDFVGTPHNIMLAPAVDGVILLAQLGRTTHKALHEAMAIIHSTNATLVGSICLRSTL